MNTAGAQKIILGAWLASMGLATVRRLTDGHSRGLPPPSTYLGMGVLFTMFFGAAAAVPSLAAALSIGVPLSIALAPYIAANGTGIGPIDSLAGALNQITSGPTQNGPDGTPAGPTA